MHDRGKGWVRITRGLFFAASGIWLGAAGLVGLGVLSIGGVPPGVRMTLAGGMAAAASILALLGWRCLRGSPRVDGIALAALVVNVLVTFTDQIGPADAAYLLFSLMLLGAFSAAWMIQRRAARANGAGI